MLLFLLLPGARAETGSGAKLAISAANYPLAYFAERIGIDRVAVNLPVPPGEDPAFWRPGPGAIRDMQKADLILLNGAGAEKWLAHVSLPRLKLVDTSAGLKNGFISIDQALTHSHGPAGQHSHVGIAHVTWLDLRQAGQQAEAVAQALSRTQPQSEGMFMANLRSLQGDLAAIDEELRALTASRPGLPLLGSHPVYQYLARRYTMNLRSVHWEPNEMPPEGEWRAFQKLLAAHAARWMIWEAQPSLAITADLEKLHVRSIVFDPCANRPSSGDFLSVMRSNLDDLKAAFR
jgi:zinc transport system substrate-binding protein